MFIGIQPARLTQRAQILLALDRGIGNSKIQAVLQVERTRIWRVRSCYRDQGLTAALYDRPRSGCLTKYGDKAEAELVALACSEPPEGYRQSSLPLLTEVARQQSHLSHVS